MLIVSQVELEHLIVHGVGNRTREEQLRLSQQELNIDEEVKKLLMQYFLSPFKENAFYHFSSPEEMGGANPVFQTACKIFDSREEFVEDSSKLAQYLYEQTSLPQIKSGEFYVTYLKGIIAGDESVSAIGLFKSENKETFLRVFERDSNYEIDSESGINIKKLDKGCLILNTSREEGFKVCIIDKVNKGNEALYWKEDFLNVLPCDDSFHQTQNYLDLCHSFVKEVFNEENDVPKADQIDMLNRSVDFFKENEKFDENTFKSEVMGHSQEVVDAFDEFKDFYKENNEVPLPDEFNIEPTAVKKERSRFKHVLKLDKNFHVYIHGPRRYVEKGYDNEKRMNYYKLYFDSEE